MNQSISTDVKWPSKAKRIWYPCSFNCRLRLAIHLKPVSVSSKTNPSSFDIVWRIFDDTVDAIMTAFAGSTPFFSARCHIHQPSREPNSLPVKTFHSPLSTSTRSISLLMPLQFYILVSVLDKWIQFDWMIRKFTWAVVRRKLDDQHQDHWPRR